MKTLVLLCLSLTVALGKPVLHPGEEQSVIEEKQSPLVGDQLPVQGHVVVENPAPQAIPRLEEHQEKVAPVEMKQSEKTAELEVEAKPEVKEDQELKAEVKSEPEVKVEEAGMAEQEVQVDKEVEQQEVTVEEEAKMQQQPEVDPKLEAEPQFKVVAEVKEEVSVEKEEAKPEMKVGEEFRAEEEVEPQPELPVEVEAELMEPELQTEPDFKVESEIKVEPDVQMELEPEEEPLLTEAQLQMSLESEIYPDQLIEERHIDMEGKYEAMGEPHMELEPLDDDSLLEDEARQDAAFQRQTPLAEALTQEEEELMSERNYVLNEETSMEIEPEMIEEPLQSQDVAPYAADLEEEAALDMAGQQMSLLESHFPEEQAGMEMRYDKQEDSVEEEEYLMMMEEARRETAREEKDNQEWRHCPGVLLEEKCYQFFKSPMTAADAEFFCQGLFPKGHLASITSLPVHRELMNLILKENGEYTRTWVGGIRYLNTNRFVWLDGAHWSYADWLSGEPNNTSGVEDCLEVLALGNGKFNDFTCWEPQPFICSHSYQ